MALEYWKWRFVNNPAGKHFIKLMWDDDLLVGHYAVSPVWFNVTNVNILAAHSLTTMTHPDYAGRGIFKQLAMSLYDELEHEKNVKSIWGFPNNNSHYGFIKNLGWKDITVIHTLSVKAAKFKFELNKSVNEFSSFKEEHVDLITRKTSSFPVKIDRNLSYLTWRYIDNPSVNYRIFGIIENKSSSLMVVKLYPSEIEGFWDINILELFIDNISELKTLLQHILACYNKKIKRITIWKSLHDPEHIYLEKIGFTADLPQIYLCARPHITISDIVLNSNNWYYSQGDSDVF